jgi:hypothetical protein
MMNCHSWLTALFVALALAGCAPMPLGRDSHPMRPVSKMILATPAVCTDQFAGQLTWRGTEAGVPPVMIKDAYLNSRVPQV